MDDIRAALFDFGGVIAEEGFQAGLYAIADRFGLDRREFLQTATEAVYSSGYVTGSGSEADFWQLVRQKTGVSAPDKELRLEILTRFVPRPRMLDLVRSIRRKGRAVAILSDQSDWLDLLDGTYQFFREFDAVFNSYHLGKTKRDPTLFDDIIKALRVQAGQALFVDDNPAHIGRADERGLQTHLFTTESRLQGELVTLGLL
jgi:putative hydrolase of the HAD superfamily